MLLFSCVSFVLDPLHFHLFVNELVNVGDDGRALYIHEDEGGHDGVVGVERVVGTGDGARVDVELVLVFVRLKPVGVTRDQNVTVELSVEGGQSLGVPPWHHLMAMTQTDFELADRNDFLLRPRRVVVKVAPYHVNVVSKRL